MEVQKHALIVLRYLLGKEAIKVGYLLAMIRNAIFVSLLVVFFTNFIVSKKDGLNPKSSLIQHDKKKDCEDKPITSMPCFLPSEYQVLGESSSRFHIRQVPGDGGCLFHSLAVCVRFLRDKSHPVYFDIDLRKLSDKLRQTSVKILRTPGLCLAMEGGEEIISSELLKMVSANYNMTDGEYLQQMLVANTWGGGPEIVALSNHLKRPIHVYELHTHGTIRKEFQLKICAKFGSPTFDEKRPLQILCADGRFPNISPGSQKDIGDHFLALFPCSVKKPIGTSKATFPALNKVKRPKWLGKVKEVDQISTISTQE